MLRGMEEATMSMTKEKIEYALTIDYDPDVARAILAEAYIEAIEALREIMSVEPGWQVDDERIPYVDIQIDKSTLKEVKAIVDKAPEAKQ
jgi:hypothetical protein